MKHYENLEQAMCRELEKLDKKYGGETTGMDHSDLELADTLYHALKSAATYHAMKDAEWDGDGRSYARGRDRMGRYVSRDMGDMSGHYPMYPRYAGGYGYGPNDGEWR